ncbi:glucans biosynthesis glucosyltransferase MdoH [Pseudooctadecabacter jejudonensis]|uniref:Glucans biosynthesis glucosyltransferase H n=1 Tax=Pseudooctadecabacter jejudonensis TaxID=1391910 RepID=A0A1Y5SSD9_9RHOB|nr:glucans biosynthesis glucosyltransferase MdoH [Pseudooctadecabacter jejudonensis]SLN44078.1 Glucans biosynthesis glucosyltransferase H [Pseudooctadecabacter jejudonensis]
MSYAAAHMPPRAPLAMPAQTFAKTAPVRAMTRKHHWADRVWRVSAFIPTLFLTVVLVMSVTTYLGQGGVAVAEGFVLALVALTFIWLAFSVNTACLGLLRVALVRGTPAPRAPHSPRDIALLVPVYNETPWEVFGNASAMLKELTTGTQADHYTLFILSDTRDVKVAAVEERAFAALNVEFYPHRRVYYRRRADNTDKKVGNITDWIENWGAAYEAMVVLDADSLMSGAAIRQLAQALADDPDAGLIQSRPTLIGATTLFGRVQQFSNTVYGWLSAEGLTSWAQHEGNYWGHNAIIRTRAFAESARLPYLRGRRGAQHLILSHDFVEAGMLRRAGWAVRLLPRLSGSFEETPQTLIDYVIRDRRWCHGNMQHLRLLAARGFHVISRVHLLQGALAFLMSPAWLAVVILWSYVGTTPAPPSAYFSSSNPLMPVWPIEQTDVAWIYLIFVYGMLLFPKAVGAVLFGLRRRTRAAYGSGRMYVGSILFELFLSVLYAPIMMVQQTKATIWAVLGRQPAWSPQNRGTAGYGWAETMRFHWVETVLGAALLGGVIFANVSWLILPIAISLAAAVPLSRLSALPIARLAQGALQLNTPDTLIEPRIVRLARQERAALRETLQNDPAPIAAE